jgi:hypothetical protein
VIKHVKSVFLGASNNSFIVPTTTRRGVMLEAPHTTSVNGVVNIRAKVVEHFEVIFGKFMFDLGFLYL